MTAVALLLAAGLLTGCTSTQTVSTDDGWEAVNKEAAFNTSRVVLAGGRTVDVEGLRVDADSASWFDARTGAFQTVPTSEVRRVQVLDRGDGALAGAKAGGIIGAVAGSVLGAYAFRNWPFAETPSEQTGAQVYGAVLYGLGFGLTGTLDGALIGYLIGHRRAYEPGGEEGKN